ncbi:F-box domain-containing protein [Strongyloides ratti]|uniref:F-box domain-containing protein n=1 Tax=Strongyloides ratti TaxID=34506 RepID=A0A090L3N7_STRRB|nr:F-box domain-containing protein [Strongyloides ratti]CEF62099.1 F-box domain-containing protein [Strongyloides ratti]
MQNQSFVPSSNFFPIESLPIELIKIILTKVDWESLQKSRLVSKLFNNIIEQNFSQMQKPRVKHLIFRTLNIGPNWKKIAFFCGLEKNINIIQNITINTHNKPFNDKKIEYYFKRMNFSKLDYLKISSTGNIDAFNILNKYFKSKTKIRYLEIDIKMYPILESLTAFLKKIKHVKYFRIKNICLGNEKIPHDYTLPKIKSMKALYIDECNCTKFINSRMINKIFEQNKNLNYIEIYPNRKNIDTKLVKLIVERQNSSYFEKCNHSNICLYLPIGDEYNRNTEFERLFYTTNYELKEPFEVFSITAQKSCEKCFSKKIIKVCFAKNFINFRFCPFLWIPKDIYLLYCIETI